MSKVKSIRFCVDQKLKKKEKIIRQAQATNLSYFCMQSILCSLSKQHLFRKKKKKFQLLISNLFLR